MFYLICAIYNPVHALTDDRTSTDMKTYMCWSLANSDLSTAISAYKKVTYIQCVFFHKPCFSVCVTKSGMIKLSQSFNNGSIVFEEQLHFCYLCQYNGDIYINWDCWKLYSEFLKFLHFFFAFTLLIEYSLLIIVVIILIKVVMK